MVLARIRPKQRGSPATEQLCVAFGLTPAELRALAALMAGQSPKQYATAQNLSCHMVHSQIGSAMAKMDCKRQVGLVRMGLSLH